MIAVVAVDLPCGCHVDVDLVEGHELGIELVHCAGQDHLLDLTPFLVTWRQLVAVTVAPLAVPEIAPGEDVVTTVPAPPAATVPPIAERPYSDRELAPGDVLTSPLTAEEWKAEADRRGITTAALLQRAREIAEANQLAAPRTLGVETVDEVLTPLVLEWLDHHHPAKGGQA